MDRREFLTGTVGCAALMATGNPLIPRPANLPAPQKPYRLGLGWCLGEPDANHRVPVLVEMLEGQPDVLLLKRYRAWGAGAPKELRGHPVRVGARLLLQESRYGETAMVIPPDFEPTPSGYLDLNLHRLRPHRVSRTHAVYHPDPIRWGADEWMLEMRKGERLWASRALSGLDGPGRALCVISHDYQVPVANIPAALFL